MSLTLIQGRGACVWVQIPNAHHMFGLQREFMPNTIYCIIGMNSDHGRGIETYGRYKVRLKVQNVEMVLYHI